MLKTHVHETIPVLSGYTDQNKHLYIKEAEITSSYKLLLAFGLGLKKKGITMKYHYTPIKIVKIHNTDNIKCWQGCRATGTLFPCWWECKIVQPL